MSTGGGCDPFDTGEQRRVLLVSPFVPSDQATHGAARELAGVIDVLVHTNEVSLVYLRGDEEPEIDSALRARLVDVREVRRRHADVTQAGVRWRRRVGLVGGMVRGRPMWVQDWWHEDLARAVEAVVAGWRPHVVQFELSVMAPYVERLRSTVARSSGTVLVFVILDPAVPAALQLARRTDGAMKLLHFLDALSWWRAERRGLRAADAAVVLTDADRPHVAGLAGRTPILTIPLSVSIPHRAADPLGSDPPSVLFVGGEQHPPNAEAAERLALHILPRVLLEVPEARLVIVGTHAGVLRSRAGEHVVFAGTVPDVVPYLDQAAVVVAPMRLGGGMRVKVLEALAAGKAVVASAVGLAGTDAAERGAAVVADSDEATAAAIVRLLRDPDERGRIAARARQWAAAELSAPQRAERYAAAFDQLLAGRAGLSGASTARPCTCDAGLDAPGEFSRGGR